MDAILEKTDSSKFSVRLRVPNRGERSIRLVKERLGIERFDGGYFKSDTGSCCYRGFQRHTRPYVGEELVEIAAHEELVVELDLSQDYDLTPGTTIRYTAAHRTVFGSVTVESNWVTI